MAPHIARAENVVSLHYTRIVWVHLEIPIGARSLDRLRLRCPQPIVTVAALLVSCILPTGEKFGLRIIIPEAGRVIDQVFLLADLCHIEAAILETVWLRHFCVALRLYPTSKEVILRRQIEGQAIDEFGATCLKDFVLDERCLGGGCCVVRGAECCD